MDITNTIFILTKHEFFLTKLPVRDMVFTKTFSVIINISKKIADTDSNTSSLKWTSTIDTNAFVHLYFCQQSLPFHVHLSAYLDAQSPGMYESSCTL